MFFRNENRVALVLDFPRREGVIVNQDGSLGRDMPMPSFTDTNELSA